MARTLESLKVCNTFDPLEMLGIKHSVISLLKSHRDHGHNGSVIRHTIAILPKTMTRRVCVFPC